VLFVWKFSFVGARNVSQYLDAFETGIRDVNRAWSQQIDTENSYD
jgi:hypothetical protein